MPDPISALIPVPKEAVIVTAFGLLCFLAGAACPVYYAEERFRGFGRTVLSRLPYQPPPGMNTEQAMVEAAGDAPDAGDGQAADRGETEPPKQSGDNQGEQMESPTLSKSGK